MSYKPTGTTAGTVAAGDDSRLSDARTPTAHKTSHQSGGTDELALAEAQVTGLVADLALLAPKANPTLTGTVTVPTPVNATDAVTKAYADALATGLSIKTQAACASTGNLTLSGEQTIDGILTSASRVLVKDQSTGSQNGIYVSAAGAWARSTDCDASAEFNNAYIFVNAGTVNGGSSFVQTTQNPTVGTTAIVWVTFSSLVGVVRTSDNLSALAATTSAQLRGVLSDETGTGAAVFATSPALVTPTGIVKGDVGLGNVDNTSDATKNAASVTLTNKTLTAPVVNSPTGIVKGDVGLGNVDNTSNATERAASATLTNKTLTSPVLNTGVSGTAVDTDATMAANSDTILASQKAVKTALAAKQDSDADLTAIAGFASRDASHYLRGDGWQAFSQLLSDLGLGASALLNLVFAGMTIPTNSLDKWKAGRSRQATRIVGAISNSATSIVVQDGSITPTTLHRRLHIESEEVFTTAGESVSTALTGITSVATTGIFTKTAHGMLANQLVVPAANVLDSFLTVGVAVYVSATNLAANTFSLSATLGGAVLTGTTNDTNLTLNRLGVLTVTTRGNVNGSAAASHADKAPVYASKIKTVVHLGDSIVEGTDGVPNSNDGWTLRAARMLSDRMGGLVGYSWPIWRQTGYVPTGANQEYTLTGIVLDATNNSYDVGFHGALTFNAATTTGFVWTRPAGLRVQAVDFNWIDKDTASAQWSYSLDGGSTWVDNPVASIYSSGIGLLRRTRVACNDPTDIRIRAATAAGVGKAIVLPWTALTTWTTYPYPAITEGVHWANLGHAGVKLRTILNARTVADGVTNGTTTLTSATAVFVAADVNSTIYLNGVAYTIASRTNATTVVLSGSPATASSVRLSILQGSGTGDWMANFLGHHGSWFPDLVIIGPYTNDIINGGTLGDGNYDFYGDMLQFLYTQISPVADILFVAPHEKGTEGATIQGHYRDTIEAIAAANSAACFNVYETLSEYGFTGYTAANTGGYMADTVHFTYKGNNWMASHLTRALGAI